MTVMNSIAKFKAAKQVQQTLKKDPNNVDALLQLAFLAGCLEPPDLNRKRQVLNHILTLEPANQKARQMLFEMDRATIGGEGSRLSAAVILTPGHPVNLPEKPLRLRYSILHQTLVYPVLALSLLLTFMALGEWDVFGGFMLISLVLFIPFWFVSATVEVSHSGLILSRLFGVYRREMEWNEIEQVKSALMGGGMKLVATDGRSLTVSSQMNGYSSIVEILRTARPNLFEATAAKTLTKGVWAKYGLFLFLVPVTPMALAGIAVPPFLPGILVTAVIFLLWSSALQKVHSVRLDESKLYARSFRKSWEIPAQQIQNIDLVTVHNRRGVANTVVKVELKDEDNLTLSGFSEGDEILYGFLQHWWAACQNT